MEHVLHKLKLSDVQCSTYPIQLKKNSRNKKKNGNVTIRKNKKNNRRK